MVWCNKGVVILCVLFLFLQCTSGQVVGQLLNKLACVEQEVCGACLSAASHCRWCADPYFGAATPRCNDYDSLVSAGCGQGMIQVPEPAVWRELESRPLQDMRGDDPVVQIQPQRVRLSLKPRETRKIKFAYRPARNYPLDLYYLMDLTWSMRDDKQTLVSLRDDLPNMLRNLTDNFRLGFGSFADKPVMPFISTDASRLANPCAAEGEACQPTYSFRHHLSLTTQVNDFIEHIKNSSVTANLDNAESQLDALVQAVTCGGRIGWAENSRKIVILLSDGLMHTAGDGKLGGAIQRNDEQCHLDENGYYNLAGTYDYPSVSQIYRLLEAYKVNVIFAVTESVKGHYDQLHKILEDFTYIARLESDSSNILKLVKTGYENIISVVNFKDDARTGPIKVKYFTDCGIKGGSMVESNRCSGVEFGMTLNFEVHLTLESCVEFVKSKQTIIIKESQLGQDRLTLDVDLQCGCDCQSGEQGGLAQACPNNSYLMCGICQCKKGWSGPTCSCSEGDEAASAALSAQCRAPTSPASPAAPAGLRALPCTGAGDCVCGKCQCDAGYSGKYCQCKDCEISRETGLQCGGAGRGACACGVCACAAGWAGAACDCTEETDACVAPGGDGGVCSGHGDCVCGKCECSKSDGVSYTGEFCEACVDCEAANPLCVHAEPCVACYLEGNCTDVCVTSQANYTVVDNIMQRSASPIGTARCILRREESGLQCEYQYTYTAGTKSMVHMDIALMSRECSKPITAQILSTGLVIMGCVIAIGIIMIIAVKVSQVYADRRAYAKFAAETERSMMMMNQRQQNPLYKSPISEFKLPEDYPRNMND
ncbi:hypothetical protein JYU34_001619 [Plutella xylostella]|uniref:Integrin beta n=1 Tax=Plutella xylostella TaxID=51655 RepID=A0ABQ7R4C8_PLUXY|nr:hypothetical protein JYU34_001619 [Plutella xylostella]